MLLLCNVNNNAFIVITTVLFENPHVFITVCSTAGQAKFGKHIINLDRRLELNWSNFKDFRNGDIIGVFDFDVNREPRERDKGKSIVELAKESAAVSGQRGCYKTSVRYGKYYKLLLVKLSRF